MRAYFLTAMLLLGGELHAQEFERMFQLELPDSVTQARVRPVDLDNDGLLDVLVSATSSNGNTLLLMYKVDTVQGIVFRSAIPTDPTASSLLLTDEDQDNDMDIMLTGNTGGQWQTTLMLNQGGFSFGPGTAFSAGGVVVAGDLDEDGRNEFVVRTTVEGQPRLAIYSRINGQWELRHDTTSMTPASVLLADFDNDGRNDLFLSGKDAVTSVLYNRGEYFFEPSDISAPVHGHAVAADLDHDGDLDVLVSGRDASGEKASVMLINHGQGFIAVSDTLPRMDSLRFFAADMNSNGLFDIQMSGTETAGDTVNIILSDDADTTEIASEGLSDQAFGDFDRDGDLDLVQSIATTDGLILVISANTVTADNDPPGKPFSPLSTAIFDRTFIYWERPGDDHTDTVSITYDVSLQTEMEQRMIGEFDLIEGSRLTVSSGNRGTSNFLLLRDTFSAYTYFIQSVDNSFHAGTNGVCVGSGNGGTGCEMTTIDTLNVCANERVELTSGTREMWFSFSRGFLGEFVSLRIDSLASDTLFSVPVRRTTDCGAVKVYLVNVVTDTTKTTDTVQYVCEDESLKFGVEPGWAEVEWITSSSGFVSGADSITFSTQEDVTLTVNVADNAGCSIQRNVNLKISKPEIDMDGEVITMLVGTQVQLDAGGGGVKYQWIPSGSLSDDQVRDPVATPTVTTAYEVTVTDSAGCVATGKILVVVESSAFVPTLFTPNGDGTNDELKVFGLRKTNSFSFTIRNREGSVVYETNDPAEAGSVGWDGMVRGNQQPAGVYYWQVQGEHDSGAPVLLNGKNNGAIVLVR